MILQGIQFKVKAKSILSYDLNKVETAEVLTLDANIDRKSAEEILKEIVNPVLQRGLIGAHEERILIGLSVLVSCQVLQITFPVQLVKLFVILLVDHSVMMKMFTAHENILLLRKGLSKADIEHIGKDFLPTNLFKA